MSFPDVYVGVTFCFLADNHCYVADNTHIVSNVIPKETVTIIQLR